MLVISALGLDQPSGRPALGVYGRWRYGRCVRLRDAISVTAVGAVDATRVWDLLAQPACWPAWAPQMRHVRELASPGAPGRVHVGQTLHIDSVAPGIGVDVEIMEVKAPHRWTMQARTPLGTVESTHEVAAGPEGTVVTVTLRWLGRLPIGPIILAAYRPIATLALRRLLRLADAEEQGAAVNWQRMCRPTGLGE